MEKFVDLLKIMIEKYLVQTVASIAAAIFGVAFLPNLFEMSDDVGKTSYGVLIFCTTFLLIQCIKHIYASTKNHVEKKQKKRLDDELSEKKAKIREKERLEKLWDYVDSLSSKDKQYLVEFLKTGNKPILAIPNRFRDGLLNNNKYVARTERYQNPTIAYSEEAKLYRLRDDFFEQLRYSYDKYGRISHFDMEEENDG